MKNVIFWAGFCLFLLIGCGEDGSSARQAGPQSSRQPSAKEVSVISVHPQPLAISNELPGRVSASMTAQIRPQVTGIIQERLFKEGSFVEKGRQLYQIDPARYEADYQRVKAGLENALAELENAQVLRKRYLRLIQVNGVSQQALDDAIARVKKAAAAVSLARAEVKTAKINLDYTKVYSPISGYIGPSAVTRGALVTAEQETALAIVRQLDPVYVDLSQPAAQTRQLQKRLLKSRMNAGISEKFEVTLVLETTGEIYPYKGNLEATDLAVDERTGAIRLRSILANPEGVLLPGMFVSATVAQIDRPPVIIIPQKSVSIQPDGTKSVWIVESDNTAKKRQVKTGPAYKNNWVILNGLESGNKVIVEGAMMLRAGMKVAPRELGELPGQGRQTPSTQPPQTESLNQSSPQQGE